MNFEHVEWLPWVLIGFTLYAFIQIKQEKRFFNWIKDHWFVGRSRSSKISSVLHWLGLFLILISLLDLRGPEEKIKSAVPKEQTIILIDSSASMQVEDVRPSRYRKALFLARHFVKKAVGHKIAIVLFSDIQKKLIPFTTDIDFLLARIGSLEKDHYQRGGSNLSMAINESIQYFKVNNDNSQKIQGNLLILTDSEETYGEGKIDVPDGVSVAFIGIGTEKGGAIPLKDSNGVFRGNKHHKGELVISKLNKSFISSMTSKIKTFSSWIVTSYSLPTDEVLRFFKDKHIARNDTSLITSKPVLLEYILIPGVLLYLLSLLLRYRRTFAASAIIFCCLGQLAMAQKLSPKEEAEKKRQEQLAKIYEEVKPFLEEIKSQKNVAINKLRVAEKYLQLDPERSYKLYSEVFGSSSKRKQKYPSSYLNYATSALMIGKIKQGMLGYKEAESLLAGLDTGEVNFKKIMRDNILLTFRKEQQKKQNKKNQKDQEQKDQDQQQDNQNQQSGDQGDQNEQNKKDSKSQDQEEKDKEKKESEKGKKDKDKKSQADEQDKKDKKDQNDPGEEMKKIQAEQLKPILKQLVNEDRQLQKKLIDTSTNSRRQRQQKKDW